MSFPLAIMDYGIGGMGLWARIKEDHPDTPLLYFSDSGAIPYGRLNRKSLTERVGEVVDFLLRSGAQHIVIACHSASSVVSSNDLLTGIRELTVRAVPSDLSKSIGIIGGARTIRAGYYRNELVRKSIVVKQRIAQPLSILIEGGDTNSSEAHAAVSRILAPISDVDRLLLACTHYPAVTDIIKSVMKEDCEIIDPIEAIYSTLSNRLNGSMKFTSHDEFYTTGNPDLMRDASLNAFKVKIENVTTIRSW